MSVKKNSKGVGCVCASVCMSVCVHSQCYIGKLLMG